MTAHVLKGDREKCLLAGMDDYIPKPIDMKLLSNRLEHWLMPGEEHAEEEVEMEMPETEVTEELLIDKNRLYEIFGDDKDGIDVFMKSLISATTELLKQIDEAIKKEDLVQAKELFHRLKGSAGNSGIMMLHKLAMQAEEKVIRKDWAEAAKLFIVIKQVFERLKLEARQW